jgi:ribosomal protein S18 acetylase RimI-like enzyme
MDAVTLLQNLNDPRSDLQQLASGFQPDVTLRVWRWDGAMATRGCERVVDWLCKEWRGWQDASLEVFASSDGSPAAVQFRVQATENGRYVEHNRALFLTLAEGVVQGIDLYCGEPIFSMHRHGYIAPATLTDDEVRAFLEETWRGMDVREWTPINRLRHDSRRILHSGSGDPHPGSNFIGGAAWTAQEADTRIEEILADCQQRGVGFEWWVMPFDTPPDLRQRLERHGLLLAGQNARMARLGLHDLTDIPINEKLTIVDLDGANDAALEALLQIDAACFRLTPEQVDHQRADLRERTAGAMARQKELYCVAYLDVIPVGMAAAIFQHGRAYLAGAATLPEYRGRGVYSTLLKHRLTASREHGYHLAAIDAGPMSKRVVEKYGFKEYGVAYIYGWMPEMDPDVIRSLVPDD